MPDSLTQRVRVANTRPVNPHGQWVLYWMTTARRRHFNLALERAAAWSRTLDKGLVILEALRCDYPWASDRLHRFIIDGMADNCQTFRNSGAVYLPYVEATQGAGSGLLTALANTAAVVVTDEFPTFFIPPMVAAAATRLPCPLEVVDGNGIIPLAATPRDYPTAHAFRRFVQHEIAKCPLDLPLEDPLAAGLPPLAPLPEALLGRWPEATPQMLAGAPGTLASLPIDHQVAPVGRRGGHSAAAQTLRRFIDRSLETYAALRNHPDHDVTSHLSGYLHFGHISVHEIFLELIRNQRWSSESIRAPHNGRREGWWGMSVGCEAFIDQLVIWRELGFNVCWHRPDHERYSSLPEWARRTLEEHIGDRREHLYEVDELAAGRTHDPLWNAAQHQLRIEGELHGYLRMLWGKKILEWSPTPRDALAAMLELNNRYAIDGRDPNSVSGIFWVLGRHDRPWAPQRPIFGSVRYMSSRNTARKLKLAQYLKKHGSSG